MVGFGLYIHVRNDIYKISHESLTDLILTLMLLAVSERPKGTEVKSS